MVQEDARGEGREAGLKKGHESGLGEGHASGIKEGLATEKVQTLLSLVRDGMPEIRVAAERAGMPVDEFEKLLSEKKPL